MCIPSFRATQLFQSFHIQSAKLILFPLAHGSFEFDQKPTFLISGFLFRLSISCFMSVIR